MTYKWIGALLIITGCGGAGFSICTAYRKEESLLRQMLSALQTMESELSYRLTPLPQLCRHTADASEGMVRRLFESLAAELEQQVLPQACDCMAAALANLPDMPRSLRRVCSELGKTLGNLDLNGQLQGLDASKKLCCRYLAKLEHNRDARLRSYQTLGLCAGAALAILLI